MAKALLDDWLSHYPDPKLIHSDGGSHFDCEVVKLIAQARGWKHTFSTVYAKWTHGVAERMNKTVLQIFRTLCRHLNVPVNKWTTITKVVQGAINRMKRPSRGGYSPIELTTSIKPVTAANIVRHGGDVLEVLDEPTTQDVRVQVKLLAQTLEEYWDLTNVARRAQSQRNRAKTSQLAIPNMGVGDYVIYAVHKPDTKLDYTWRGPGEIVERCNRLVYKVKPCTQHDMPAFEAHVARLRRFAGAHQLNMTEQLKLDISRDHPDNIVSKLVGHRLHEGDMWFMCRWKGFTKEIDSLQAAEVLLEDCPAKVLDYLKKQSPLNDKHLKKLADKHFPTMSISCLLDTSPSPRDRQKSRMPSSA